MDYKEYLIIFLLSIFIDYIVLVECDIWHYFDIEYISVQLYFSMIT